MARAFMLPNSNMLSAYICTLGNTKVATHTHNESGISTPGRPHNGSLGAGKSGWVWRESTWGSKFGAQWLAGCLGTDGRRRHRQPIEIQDPKWLLLLCTHRQMMALCQWIADMHLCRQVWRDVGFFFWLMTTGVWHQTKQESV